MAGFRAFSSIGNWSGRQTSAMRISVWINRQGIQLKSRQEIR